MCVHVCVCVYGCGCGYGCGYVSGSALEQIAVQNVLSAWVVVPVMPRKWSKEKMGSEGY
jgi:F0F1-type ATP synthase membrane subunit c/vacuolar-type H+-ATPase subunit K